MADRRVDWLQPLHCTLDLPSHESSAIDGSEKSARDGLAPDRSMIYAVNQKLLNPCRKQHPERQGDPADEISTDQS
jgi:hypothetical protein